MPFQLVVLVGQERHSDQVCESRPIDHVDRSIANVVTDLQRAEKLSYLSDKLRRSRAEIGGRPIAPVAVPKALQKSNAISLDE